MGGYTPSNYVMRMTPNLHINAYNGYAVIINWDQGTTGGTQTFRVGNGAGSDAFYVTGDGSTYSPVIYDINDTGYYVNPNSNTNLNRLLLNNGIGAFADGVGNDPYGFISVTRGTGANYAYFGMTRSGQLGMGFGIDTSNQIWFGGTSSGYSATRTSTYIYFNTSGDFWAVNSSRAPIFYDSDNTAYYVNPASLSNLTTVNTQNAVSNNVNGLRNINPGGGSYVTSASSVSGAIKITLPTTNYPMIRFTVKVYTYDGLSFEISCGGHTSSGFWYNTFAYMTTQNRSALNVRFTYGGGSTYVYIGELGSSWAYPQVFITDVQVGYTTYDYSYWDDNWAIAFDTSTYNSVSSTHVVYPPPSSSNNTNAVYASIYYDADNTGTYINPNGASIISSGGSYPMEFRSTQRYITRFWNSSVSGNGIWIANDANTLVFHFDSIGDRASLTSGGTFTATGDVRAPIFYDSNDTGYYLDPNSTSRTYRMGAYYFQWNGSVSDDHPFGLYFDSGLSSAYAIYRESGSWTYPYPDLRIAFHTGIKIGANSSYQGVRFYTDYDMSTQVMSVNNGSDPLGGSNVYVNNSLQAGSSLRAPIFYDSNDTGYYLDPNSVTALRTVGDWRSDSSSWSGEFSGKIQYHASNWYFQAASGFQFRASSGAQLMYCDSGGNATFNGNVTAYSDRRLKDNIRDLTEAKTYLSKIAAKRFTWKDEGYEDIGFIAQDVEAAGLPEFVLETQDYDPNTGVTSDPVKTLDYGRMVSVLWQAVRELTEEVETLKSRLH
jgi:hypothetical protein